MVSYYLLYGSRRDELPQKKDIRADIPATRSVRQGDRGEGDLAGEDCIAEKIRVLCLFMHCAALERFRLYLYMK